MEAIGDNPTDLRLGTGRSHPIQSHPAATCDLSHRARSSTAYVDRTRNRMTPKTLARARPPRNPIAWRRGESSSRLARRNAISINGPFDALTRTVAGSGRTSRPPAPCMTSRDGGPDGSCSGERGFKTISTGVARAAADPSRRTYTVQVNWF